MNKVLILTLLFLGACTAPQVKDPHLADLEIIAETSQKDNLALIKENAKLKQQIDIKNKQIHTLNEMIWKRAAKDELGEK